MSRRERAVDEAWIPGSRRGCGVLVAAACSSAKSGDDANPTSVTIKHIFGETTIAAPPKRVVSAGFTEQDDLLAVGVVPIAVTNWFGDQPFGVWPWAPSQARIGPARCPQPGQRDSGGPDRGAQTRPDRRCQRRVGRRHLQEAVGHRADHRPVRRRRLLRAMEGPGRCGGNRGVPGQADEAGDRRRRRQVRRRGQEQPRLQRQEGGAAGGQLLRWHDDRDAARLAHRLPDRDGPADRRQHHHVCRRRPPGRDPARQARRRPRFRRCADLVHRERR